ncbi:MAG TPA: inorganic diphosphatase, partial [Gemmatimonadales bacterium]|nr:inorganic diphosphatase [Gemmatimonadales bacterium]
TLAFQHSQVVPHPYPFPYGFVIGTDAGDGGNVDCYVITNRQLKTGQVVECEPLALMEQFEDGVEDHNILARLLDEPVVINEVMEAALTEHVLACFRDTSEPIAVGRFLGREAALAHIASHLEPA